ncbi:MAG: sarcosine oxidase subunit delta [Rhodospirillales bacterium]|nr:sarcosine oxidase subunit delta [Rhodospirillales bacterium]
MKIMPCPLNGPRNISEFAYGGEVSDLPAPDCDNETWIDYVYLENNLAGIVREWWYHTPTAFWFIAERDTRSDEILKTYPASDVYRDRVDFTPPRGASKAKE